MNESKGTQVESLDCGGETKARTMDEWFDEAVDELVSLTRRLGLSGDDLLVAFNGREMGHHPLDSLLLVAGNAWKVLLNTPNS